MEVKNQVSMERLSWLLIVKVRYNASINPISERVFPRASALELTGQVEYFEGNRIAELLSGFVPVIIEIKRLSGERELTNQDGTFSTVFYPVLTEYGSYVAGARHPHVAVVMEQTSWVILGMSATPRFLRLRNSVFEMVFYNVSMLRNEGPQILRDITAMVSLAAIEHLSVTVYFNQTTLEPNEATYIDIELRASQALGAIFPITVKSKEGVTVILSIDLQILPELVAIPPSIHRRVVRGMLRTLDFNITNVGTIAANKAVSPRSEFLTLTGFGNAI